MPEDNKAKTDYASNSAKSKIVQSESAERPKLQQISAASVRKKGIGSKFKETFAGDSAESVMQYVIFDIIQPRLKDLLFEMISGGSERALFGSSTRSSRGRRSKLTDKTDYRGFSSGREREREPRELPARDRANHRFDEILIPTRGEAEQILDTLIQLVDQYDSATVADLYDACGISRDHTDLKWGWTDLSEARIDPARGGGYILDMPRVEQI